MTKIKSLNWFGILGNLIQYVAPLTFVILDAFLTKQQTIESVAKLSLGTFVIIWLVAKKAIRDARERWRDAIRKSENETTVEAYSMFMHAVEVLLVLVVFAMAALVLKDAIMYLLIYLGCVIAGGTLKILGAKRKEA